MKLVVESVLTRKSMLIVNKIITACNRYDDLTDIVKYVRSSIMYMNLNDDYICGTGANHLWVSNKLTGERILILS